MIVFVIGVPGENYRLAASNIMLYQVHLVMSVIQTHNFSGDRHRLQRKL
jgi:hypothetical protein